MSGKNNVNPDHYKVAGRDRPNEVLAAQPHAPDPDAYLAPARGRGARNFIPGALPVGEAPAPRARPAARKPAGRANRPARSTKTSAKRATRATVTSRKPRAATARKRQAAPRGKRPAMRARRTAA